MNSTIEGSLLSLSSQGFEGWAWDSSRPYDPVEIEVFCGDVILATAKADGFSLELVKARKGNGMHMFYAMPDSLPNVPYPSSVQARVRGHAGVLSGAINIDSPLEFKGILPESFFQRFEGYVDGIKGGFVLGWVINELSPSEPVEVELWDGEEVIVTATANHYRPDVESKIPEGGNSGFELALPYSLLDGAMHNLRVLVAGTRHELGNSPLIFGLGSGNALVKEILRLREMIQALEARQGELTRDLIARFEALYSIQRDAFEREIQAIKVASLGLPRQTAPQSATKIADVETESGNASERTKPILATVGVDEPAAEQVNQAGHEDDGAASDPAVKPPRRKRG